MKEDESALEAVDMMILSVNRRVRTMSRAEEMDKAMAELRTKSPCMSEKDLKDLRRLAEKTTRARKEHNPTARNPKKK